MKCRVLANTKDMPREEWLKCRRGGIGGSDAGALAGVNPWKSPLSVYLEKIGESSGPEDNERMRIGRDLEDYVAQRFMEATGLKVRRRNAILLHNEYDWIMANVDRLIVGVEEGLECKTTSSYGASKWEGDKIPPHYEVQCHHYMAVTGAKAWWIACLIGNEKFVYKKIERDEEVIEALIKIEKDFWENYVLKKEMPAPDGSSDADNILNLMYPKSKESSIELVGYEDKIHKLKELKDKISEFDNEKKSIEQLIKKEMGENELATVGDKKITWKSSISNRFDSKRFKVDYPELYGKYLAQSNVRRFSIK